MKRFFTWNGLLLFLLCCGTVSTARAAEKSKTLIQCDLARSAVASAEGKVEGNKDAAADLERARTALKNADECQKAGTSMFGFGGLNPETEREIKLSVDAAELATATALSRIEFARATAELEAIEKQYGAVKAKLNLFEQRKAEMERLRQEVAALQNNVKELEVVKAEKAALALQVEQLAVERARADKLTSERLALTRQLDELKTENARLIALQEKQQEAAAAAAAAAAPASPAAAPEDPKKKTPKKP
jgi:DNA repair exonuclease SbcCD ATPase subunit